MTYAEPSADAVLIELAELTTQEAAVTERKLRTLILARALGATWVQLAGALGFTSPHGRHSARSHHAHALRVITAKDGLAPLTPAERITQRQARDWLAARTRKETPDAYMAP